MSSNSCFSFLTDSVDQSNESISSPIAPSVTTSAKPSLTNVHRGCTEEEFAACSLSVVLCPPDRGVWAKLTRILSFLATLICDGVWLSLLLFDGRVGMTDRTSSPRTRTLEHMAAVSLFRHLVEPFSCAFINRYGFRYCLFFGSVLSIAWLILLISFMDNPFNFEYCFLLALVGGIGIGMIKMTFFVLLSTLFIVNRPIAHLIFHLGSYTGILLIVPLTEYMLLISTWKSALHLHIGLMCFTLVFWLLIATPVPLKIQVLSNELILKTSENFQSRMTFRSVEDDSVDNLQFPTIHDRIGNGKKLIMVPFTENTPLNCCTNPLENVMPKNVNWLYENDRKRPMCIRNVTNMFKTRLIGSRPMYRDDVLVDGNVVLFSNNLNLREYGEYLMTMTRVFTVADLNEEKHKRFNVFPISVSRVLKPMFNLSIWKNEKTILFVAGEMFIHASVSCYIPFIIIKGPSGLKSSAEAMITLIVGCVSLLSGRGFGYLLHGTSSNISPLYHVALVLMANSVSLFLCVTIDIAKIIPYFGIFGFLFGYYKSIENVVMYSIYPLRKLNVIHGQISIVRGLSSLFGILIAINIQKDKEPMIGNEDVYVFAGSLMMAGSVCIGLLSLMHLPSVATANTFVRWSSRNSRQEYYGRQTVHSRHLDIMTSRQLIL